MQSQSVTTRAARAADPVFAAIAEKKAREGAWRAAPDEGPAYDAAGKRFSVAQDILARTVPVTGAGIAASLEEFMRDRDEDLSPWAQGWLRSLVRAARRLGPAGGDDPVIAAIGRYRIARIAYEDARREADEARDAVDMMTARSRIAVTNPDSLTGKTWCEREGQVDACIRAALKAERARSPRRPGRVRELEAERKHAKQWLRFHAKGRARALALTRWPELAKRANETMTAMYRAERAVLWTLARSPAGIANQARLMLDAMAEAREGRGLDPCISLWCRARDFLMPFAQTIERSALRLARAA